MKYMNPNYPYFNYPNFYLWVGKNPDIKIVAEIGCFLGDSTVFLAREMMRNKKEFKIYAVDLWEDIEKYRPFRDDEKEL